MMQPELIPSAPAQQGKKLLDQFRDAIRLKHYSRGTEKTYVFWVREYILFHKKRHPRNMDVLEINQFLIDKPSGLRTIKTTICASLENFDCTNLICLVY